MLKVVLGLIVGVIAAFGSVYILELIAHQIFPGVALTGSRASLPIGTQIFVIAAYLIGGFVGALVGGRIANRRWVAWAVAAVVTTAAIAGTFQVDQPLIMDIATVLAAVLGGYFGARMVPDRVAVRHDGGSAHADV